MEGLQADVTILYIDKKQDHSYGPALFFVREVENVVGAYLIKGGQSTDQLVGQGLYFSFQITVFALRNVQGRSHLLLRQIVVGAQVFYACFHIITQPQYSLDNIYLLTFR